MLKPTGIENIALQARDRIATLFPGEQVDAILYGSYARGDAQEGSDLDLFILVDSPRERIAEKNWHVGEKQPLQSEPPGFGQQRMFLHFP